MKISSLGFGLATALLLAGCGGGGGGTATPAGKPFVTVLTTAVVSGAPAFVNGGGFVVYVFDGDAIANQSTCTGGCAAVWPPVAPPAVTLAAPWTSFARADASQQLSYNGKPLYTFVNDTQKGVATGDGVNGFHIARPASGSGNGVPPGYPG